MGRKKNDAPERIAEERIRQAAETQATSLNLSGLGLHQVPESLGQLSELRELYLHDNPALGLPAEVLGPT
jgi:hypothetical protein